MTPLVVGGGAHKTHMSFLSLCGRPGGRGGLELEGGAAGELVMLPTAHVNIWSRRPLEGRRRH